MKDTWKQAIFRRRHQRSQVKLRISGQQEIKKRENWSFSTDVAVGIVSKWYKQYFLDPAYIIAMYLSPKYCNLARSKNFSHGYLKPEIVKLAMNWKFKKDECIQLAQDIYKYTSFIFTNDHKTMTQCIWKTTQQFTEPTRKLASFVFQLKGHAAPVETLFS